jgi:hypothetical protein
MKIKLLRRFCADEVKLLLERMDNHFAEEFVIDDSKWESLLPHGQGFRLLTSIEQHCINTEYRAHLSKFKKAQAYQEILERAMSPAKTRWEYREEKEGRPKTLLTTKAIKDQALSVLEEELKKSYAQSRLMQQPQFIPPQQSTLPDPWAQLKQ